MKIVAHGSTLIELFLYLSLGTFLVCVCSLSFIKWQKQVNDVSKKLSAHVSFVAGLDLFERDLCQAPALKDDWKLIQTDYIIWRVNSAVDCGYMWKGRKLFRFEGQWSASHNQWLHKIQSLVIDHLILCSFAVNVSQGKKINSVTYEMTTPESHKSKNITLCQCEETL